MRFFIFAFFCLSVASAAVTNRQAFRLTAGQTYVYDYSSRLLSGIPELQDQFAGLSLESQIVLQATSSDAVVLKMTSVQIGKHNGPIGSDGQPIIDHQINQQLSRELSKPIRFQYSDGKVKAFEADQSEPEWSLNMKKAILSLLNVNLAPKKIIKSVKNNQIVRQSEDLTVYPVYEDGIGGICETVYEISQIMDPKNYHADQVADQQMVLNVTKTRNYDNCLTEPSIVNDNYDTRGCPWVCRQDKSYPAVQGYYPTPDAVSDPYMSGCPCGQEPHESPVDAYNHVKYNISLQNAFPVIESVFSDGKIVYSVNGDQLVVLTQQNLTLTAKGAANVNIAAIPRPQRHTDLSFRIPKPQMPSGVKIPLDIPYYHLFGEVNHEELKNIIPELLDSLASDVVSGDLSATKESMQKSVQMVNAMAVLPEQDLHELYEKVAKNGMSLRSTQKEQVIRKLFLDALPLSGSNPAALVIKQLILSNKVSTFEAKELVEAVPQNLFLIDTETLDSYLELLQNPSIQSRRHLSASVAIAFGKMVKEACLKRQTTPGDIPDQQLPHQIRSQAAQQVVAQTVSGQRVTVQSPALSQRMKRSSEWESAFIQDVCREQDVQKYVTIVARLLDSSNKYHEKVTLIETLAHMGVPHVLPVLEPYISGRISAEKCPGYVTEKKANQDEECDFIRQVAIYALSHVTEHYPKQVLPLVLPVYSDASEPYEVRIAAYTTLLSADPEKQVLQRIAADLHRENNRQIRSFVFSSLQTIANISVPCYEKVAHNAQHAFPSAPEAEYGAQYSKMIGQSFYDDQKDFGLYSIAEWVSNNVSRVPRSAYFSVGQSSGPFQDELIQFGFNAKGMESLVERVLEPNGLLSDLFDGLNGKGKDRRVLAKRNADSAQQALEALKNKLDLEIRGDDEPKATVFFKLFDRTSYYPLDKHYVHQLIDSMEDSLKDISSQLLQGMDYHYVKLVMPSQIYKVLPSEIGLPVVVSHRHPVLLSLKVDQAKLQLETAPKTVYPTGANITAQIQPSIFYSSYAFAFAVNPADRTAIGVHSEKTSQATLPVEVSLGFSRPKNLLTWSVIPKTAQEVVYHRTESSTFIAKTSIAGAPDRDWLQDAKPIKTMAVPLKHSQTYGQEVLGLGVRVQLNSENPWSLQPIYASETYAKHGLVAAVVESWRNPGLAARELHVQLESDAEEPVTGYDVTMRYKWIANDLEGKDSDDSDESSASSESDSDESDASSASHSSESKSSESQSSESSSKSKSSKSSEESNESKNLKQRIRQRMQKTVQNSRKSSENGNRNKRSANKESNESSDESSNESGSKSWSKSGSKESSQSSSSESNSSEQKRKNHSKNGSKNQSKNSQSARSSESSSSSSEGSDESHSFEDKVFDYESVMKLILGQDFKKRDIKRIANQLLRKTQNIWQNNWDEDYDQSSEDASNQDESTEVPATIAHDFAITAVARGPRPTFYAANVLYVHTYDHRIVWLKTDGHVKTPKGVYMTVPTLFCADAVLSYPTIPNEFYYERTQMQSQKAKLQAQLGWGQQCQREGGIVVTGVLENTEDHVITADDLAVQSGAAASHVQNWYYRQCAIDRAEGQSQSYACERALIEDSYFNQMIVDLKYKNVNKEIHNLTAKAVMALKVALYPHLEIDPSADNADNQIRIVAQYSSRIPDIQLANLEIKSPSETARFERIHIPHIRPVSALLPTQEVYANLIHGYDATSKCALMEDFVRTFDNVTFKTPESQCQYLLAKDCSPRERFAVFAQYLNFETKTKTITVLTQGLEIKLLPPLQQNVAQVVVNGHAHEVLYRQPITLVGENNDLRVYLRATPSDAVNPIIVLESDVNALRVKYDGKNAKIEIGNEFKGKTCGLCGDNNDESEEEFSGPNQCVYDRSDDFANSYALSGQHCEQTPVAKGAKRCPQKNSDSSEEGIQEYQVVKQIQTPSGQTTLVRQQVSQEMSQKQRSDVVQSQANAEELARQQQQHLESQMARQQSALHSQGQDLPLSPSMAAMAQTPQQQQLLQRLRTQYISRDDMICFTTRPLLACVQNATPSAVKQVKVDFHCLPKASPFTQQLIVDSEKQILKQLANKRVDLRQTLDVPVQCQIAVQTTA